MFDLFTVAHAAEGAAPAGGGASSILMIVVMIAIFYFLLIRPENKRKKQAEAMRGALKKGDWLTTIGGDGRISRRTNRGRQVHHFVQAQGEQVRQASTRYYQYPRTGQNRVLSGWCRYSGREPHRTQVQTILRYF